MPQISPMSWILIIISFIFVILSVKANLPDISSNSPKSSNFKNIYKKMKW